MIEAVREALGNVQTETDYASFIVNEYMDYNGIEKLFAKYGDTIHRIIPLADIMNEMPLSDFMYEYCQGNGFEEDRDKALDYPNQSITFSKDYASEDDKLPFVNSVLIKIDPQIILEQFKINLDETQFTIHFDSDDKQQKNILVYPHNEQTIEISYNNLLLPPNNITE